MVGQHKHVSDSAAGVSHQRRREWLGWLFLGEWLGLLAWLAVPYDRGDWQVIAAGLHRFGPDLYGEASRVAVGPLGVLATGIVDAAVGRRGGVLVTAAVTLGCLVVGVRALTDHGISRARVLLMSVLLSPILVANAVMGHLDDALTLLLLLGSLVASRGLLVGLALAVKPWAVAGLPPGRRSLLTAGAVAAVGYVAFLPSLLHAAGVLPLVQRASTWAALGAQPPSWWRAAELLLMATTALVVTQWRGVFSGLLAAFAVRCLLDPGDFTYYCTTLGVLAVLMDSVRFRGRVLVVVAVYLAGVTGEAWLRTILLVALLALAVVPADVGSGTREENVPVADHNLGPAERG